MVQWYNVVLNGTITNKITCATPTKRFDFTIEQISATPIVPKNEIAGHSVIRQAFRSTSILPEIANVITNSLEATTENRYELVLRG